MLRRSTPVTTVAVSLSLVGACAGSPPQPWTSGGLTANCHVAITASGDVSGTTEHWGLGGGGVVSDFDVSAALGGQAEPTILRINLDLPIRTGAPRLGNLDVVRGSRIEDYIWLRGGPITHAFYRWRENGGTSVGSFEIADDRLSATLHLTLTADEGEGTVTLDGTVDCEPLQLPSSS
jgi:hypothetical protein